MNWLQSTRHNGLRWRQQPQMALLIAHGGRKMLVLSRKAGERVCIGNGVEVVVLEAKGGRVRLGFEAPPEVPIHRHEVILRDQMLGAAVEMASDAA
jgi:carbon storage regulator